jgi:hypothetical protein
MLFKRRKNKPFTVLKPRNIFTVKGRRTLRIGKEEFYVFQCGDETVVYQGNDDVFNSARDGITYRAWINKYKREKGILN